jgi:xanthine/uracil permease
MLIPMGCVIAFHARRNRALLVLLLLAGFCTLVPAWMFTYVRIRYLVKFFPAFIVLVISGCEELSPSRPWINKMLWASGIGTIIWQLIYFEDMFINSHWR